MSHATFNRVVSHTLRRIPSLLVSRSQKFSVQDSVIRQKLFHSNFKNSFSKCFISFRAKTAEQFGRYLQHRSIIRYAHWCFRIAFHVFVESRESSPSYTSGHEICLSFRVGNWPWKAGKTFTTSYIYSIIYFNRLICHRGCQGNKLISTNCWKQRSIVLLLDMSPNRECGLWSGTCAIHFWPRCQCLFFYR